MALVQPLTPEEVPSRDSNSSRRSRSARHILRVVHRTLGLFGAIVIIIMGITGLLLNHKSLIGYSSNSAAQLQEFLFGLHSGQIGNLDFRWITDFGSLCMVVLSVTGIWMWLSLFLKKGRRR